MTKSRKKNCNYVTSCACSLARSSSIFSRVCFSPSNLATIFSRSLIAFIALAAAFSARILSLLFLLSSLSCSLSESDVEPESVSESEPPSLTMGEPLFKSSDIEFSEIELSSCLSFIALLS
ncbi:hypothetical protein V8G54_002932 [Vigna mungo]|uniref:Uncharacterized protein n=1 Tax=Vigna mungo TaxID=3915 RepID=A0AAQ3PA38_VIGMU